MSPLRRVLVGGIAIASTLLLVAIGGLLSAPLWIDAGAVKKEIASLVLRATGDVVELDRLQLHLFPSISVEVANPRYTVADAADLTARLLIVDLDLPALITGRVQPKSIRLSGVEAVIRLPAPEADAQRASAVALEARLREILAQLVRDIPGLNASTDGAILTLHAPGRPPFELNDLAARLRTADGRIEAKLTCSSDFWERLALEFSIGADDLHGGGRLEFDGLQSKRLARQFGIDTTSFGVEASLIGRVDWQMRGLSDLTADAIASSPRLVVNRDNAAQEIAGVSAAAGLELKGAAVKLQLHGLYAQAPHVLLSGTLVRDASGQHEFALNASRADLAALQAAARTLAPEIPWISKPPVSLRAGTLGYLNLRGSGNGFAQMFELSALRGEAALEGVTLDIAQPAITLAGVGGRIALEGGEIRIEGATAALGNSVLRGGRLAMQVSGDPSDLKAGAEIGLDLGEAIALARKLIKRKDIDAHLDAIEKLEGNALARVAVWGKPQALQASVEMSELAVFLRHRYVPLPLRLRSGRFNYAEGAISFHDASGEFGRSGFDGLDASLQLAAPYRFKVAQRSARLSLEELYTAARHIPVLGSALSEIRALTGKAAVSEIRAEGSLRAPAQTRFRAIVSPHNVKLLAQRLDSDILIDGGSAEITERKVELRDVAVNSLDSSLRISADVGNYRSGIRAIEARADGRLGAMTLDRIYKAAGIGPAMQLRAPLVFSDAAFAWRDSGDVSFSSKVSAAGSIAMQVGVRMAANKVSLDRLSLKDASSDANISAESAGGNINARFRGKLTGGTLANLFIQSPVSMDAIEGDMQADLHRGEPYITRARGRLQAAALTIPGNLAVPLKFEYAVLTANGDKVRVEQAVLFAGSNRLELDGDFHRENAKIVLDANLRADRIVLSKAMMESGQGEAGSEQAFRLSDLPVTGRVGLDIRIVETERMTLAPLVAEVAVAGENLDLRITEAALCGITMSGTLKGRLEDIRMAGGLSAHNADLQKSISCLTSERIVGSGQLDLEASFSAEGPLAALGERLDGRFNATARDGHIDKFDTLNRVFSFLNVTELVRGQNLGATGKGLPYRSIQVKGTLSGKALHFEEIAMDAPSVHIVAAGRADYGTGKLAVDVLVAPLQTANVVLDNLPLIKRIFGGTVLALPVQVLGTLQDPIVVPLGPGAIASRMTSIIANTLRLPFDAITVFSPSTVPAPGGAPP